MKTKRTNPYTADLSADEPAGSLHPAGSATGYVCNWCDKRVRTYVPKGGDGSAKTVMSHKNKRGELCNGSWKLLPWA